MKNKEFYKDKIYEIACKRDCFAVNKSTKEINGCLEIPCSYCLFSSSPGNGDCHYKAIEWLEQEHIEPILNDVEKRYLEAVLMPFQNRVLYVAKYVSNNSDKAYLEIRIKSILEKNYRESVILPFFHSTKMYVGMEENRRYTLEELELFTDEEK